MARARFHVGWHVSGRRLQQRILHHGLEITGLTEVGAPGGTRCYIVEGEDRAVAGFLAETGVTPIPEVR